MLLCRQSPMKPWTTVCSTTMSWIRSSVLSPSSLLLSADISTGASISVFPHSLCTSHRAACSPAGSKLLTAGEGSQLDPHTPLQCLSVLTRDSLPRRLGSCWLIILMFSLQIVLHLLIPSMVCSKAEFTKMKAVGGSVLVYNFWTPPRPPPSYQFCTWPFIFQQIYYYLFFCYLGLG